MSKAKLCLRDLNFSSYRLAIALFVCLSFSACVQTHPAIVEQQPAYQPAPVTPNSIQLNIPKLVSPKPHEVQHAVKRVFKDVAVVDSTTNPNFIVGDFNGDVSQDLAVVIKPAAGKLAAINAVYPSWLLRDPFATSSATERQFQVAEGETLLAVIHGFGPNDWRDPQATQTFLLKNSVGKALEAISSADFIKANSGRKLPRVRGDVISESLHGSQGWLYFAGASYQWYDPKTFRGETDLNAVHGRNRTMRK